MKAARLHGWNLTPAQAFEVQRNLAGRIVSRGDLSGVRFVAGVDVSVRRASGVGRGAVAVLTYPGLDLVETQVAERRVDFPYVPGLLSFREGPVVLEACEKLSHEPDLILVDGQGLAHPRRLGLASHLGLLWDKPTIGCAKSRLCGEHGPVGTERGDSAILVDGDDTIGMVLRTRTNVKPLYVSVGHCMDLNAAVRWVLKCSRGFRLPEPTRLAHQAAGGHI